MRHGPIEPDDIIPPGAEVEALRRRLKKLRRLAWMLNGAFRIPGIRFRFGLDTFLMALPGGGDAIQALLSLYIVWEARRMGIATPVLGQMLRNVAIEAGVGLLPVLGDVFGTVFKADLRNIALIEDWLRTRPFPQR